MASDTRDRLIRTTSRLLRRQGYGATGLNQVMTEADAPRGSMYFHFPGGKEELASAAIDYFDGRVCERLDKVCRESATVGVAVTRVFDDYIALLERTEFSQGCPVATVALDAAASHPALAEATGRALGHWIDLLAGYLRRDGWSPDESHRLATLVIAAIEGTVVMAKGQRSVEPLVATRDQLQSILVPPG